MEWPFVFVVVGHWQHNGDSDTIGVCFSRDNANELFNKAIKDGCYDNLKITKWNADKGENIALINAWSR